MFSRFSCSISSSERFTAIFHIFFKLNISVLQYSFEFSQFFHRISPARRGMDAPNAADPSPLRSPRRKSPRRPCHGNQVKPISGYIITIITMSCILLIYSLYMCIVNQIKETPIWLKLPWVDYSFIFPAIITPARGRRTGLNSWHSCRSEAKPKGLRCAKSGGEVRSKKALSIY